MVGVRSAQEVLDDAEEINGPESYLVWNQLRPSDGEVLEAYAQLAATAGLDPLPPRSATTASHASRPSKPRMPSGSCCRGQR